MISALISGVPFERRGRRRRRPDCIYQSWTRFPPVKNVAPPENLKGKASAGGKNGKNPRPPGIRDVPETSGGCPLSSNVRVSAQVPRVAIAVARGFGAGVLSRLPYS